MNNTMHTYRTTVPVGEDRTIRLEIPCDLPPGPVQVVVLFAPKPRTGAASPSANGEPSSWDELDPQEWVDIMRSGDDIGPYLKHWEEKLRNDAPR